MENIEITDLKDLSCGENIYQNAAIAPIQDGIDYEILSENKDLEYRDFLDMTTTLNLLAEFFDVNASVITKEAMVCSCALANNIKNAFTKAADCNPFAITGSTAGFTKTVTSETASELRAMKVRNVIAPDFEKQALTELKKNNGINIIKINSPLQELLGFNTKDIKVTPFGILVQDQNHVRLEKSSFKVVTKTKPEQQQAEDAVFAWKISKHLKSLSAVIVKDLATKAIVQANTDITSQTEFAMNYACESSKDAVLALDSAIESEGIINAAIQGRIALIIEAGNGINSDKIIKLADKYNLSMIATGIRINKY